MKHEHRAIAINPFDGWVFGNLIEIYDSITETTKSYIQTNNSRILVDDETICRLVYECEGVKFYDKDIIEYNFEDFNGIVRRIEPIIDDSLIVWVGRQRNAYAKDIIPYFSELNIKVIGNMIEDKEHLSKGWCKI